MLWRFCYIVYFDSFTKSCPKPRDCQAPRSQKLHNEVQNQQRLHFLVWTTLERRELDLTGMGDRLVGLEDYIDEERALGFHVWVAELELLVGTAKGRQVDQARNIHSLLHPWRWAMSKLHSGVGCAQCTQLNSKVSYCACLCSTNMSAQATSSQM